MTKLTKIYLKIFLNIGSSGIWIAQWRHDHTGDFARVMSECSKKIQPCLPPGPKAD